MIEKGEDYIFAEMQQADRGWVFCPEYSGASPLEISPVGWDTRIFLFGPSLLPDSDFRRDSIVDPSLRENPLKLTPRCEAPNDKSVIPI